MSTLCIKYKDCPKQYLNLHFHILQISSGSRGAEWGHAPPPGPVKIGHKKMATKGGRIDFMFLAPPPYPAAGSATANLCYFSHLTCSKLQ